MSKSIRLILILYGIGSFTLFFWFLLLTNFIPFLPISSFLFGRLSRDVFSYFILLLTSITVFCFSLGTLASLIKFISWVWHN